ncbi:hypothetical protein [Aliivibrio fischeri]|uniref:hypothetical protein n=1 Tax=Aliivibrio fischeri TaxID=668 RepID=UPI0037350FC0
MIELLKIKLYSGKNKSAIKDKVSLGNSYQFDRKDCWASINKSMKGHKYPECHPWYIDDADGVSVTGHHILSVAGITYVSKGERFGDLLKGSKYDVNHSKNIVPLTTISELACELAIPLHYGNHRNNSIPSLKEGMSYHILTEDIVTRMLKLLAKNGVCPGDNDSDKKDIVLNMDYVSTIMLGWITDFKVILHQYGGDYQVGKDGCRSNKKLKEKDKNLDNTCHSREHGYKNQQSKTETLKVTGRLKTAFEIENPGLEYNE